MQGQWSCDAPDRHRQIELRAIFGGVSRALDVEFGDSVSVTTARDLSLRAISIFEDPGSSPENCKLAGSEPSSRSWHDVRSAYSLAPAERPQLDVSADDYSPKADKFRVSLFSTLTIDFPSGCWAEWMEVVVT